MQGTSRISIGCGRWFDRSKSRCWEENSNWDGNNFISTPTGSQWEHEELYLTASKRWILRRWSQWQGTRDTYQLIQEGEAHVWLVDNGHFGAIPSVVTDALEV